MLYVTDLTGYLYCKRKLYLTKVLGHKEPLSRQALVGSIKHKVLENVHNSEERVIKSLDHIPSKKDLLSLFILTDSSIAHSIIAENLDRLSHFSIDYTQLLDELSKMIEDESKVQAEKIMKEISSHKVVGQELIDKIYPKIKAEMTLESKELGLRGKIDKIEFYKDSIIPVEIKTGQAGRGSPWQDHITQLTAYCILLEKEHGKSVNKGAIIYYNPRVVYEVSINPFMVDEVHSLIKEVNSTLSKQVLPDILKNQNKCNICGLKDICHNLN